jgi:N-acetylglutamate synthase-like GNAT family acetyltransferase
MSQLAFQSGEINTVEPARPPSWRLELIITLLGLLGLVLFLAFYDRAFPSAAIDLELSRAEIAQRAEAYLQSLGYDLQGYEFALSFQEDWGASVYLQRTLGVPETNRLVHAERLPIWTWHARWFRPLQKEEFSVSLAPDGEVVAFAHTIPEDAPGASLPQAQARALAEAYLVAGRARTLEDWEQVSASSQEQPGGRVDHYFEWKRRGFAIGDGDLRLSVTVQGDRVGSSGLWLRVPEAFQRRFSEQSDRAGFFNGLSFMIGFFGFGLAGLLAYLVGIWRGGLRWHAGLWPALAFALVSLLAGLNTLPLNKAWYDTTQDYALFWLQQVLNLVYGASFGAVPIFILWAGGGQLSQRVWPRRDKLLPRSDDRWGVLARSGWRGVMLGGMMGGYVVLFYLIATRWLGGWTPLDVPYTDLYATPLPFLGPLEGGLLPALDEELVFRLVGISLILGLTRRRWLALLVPGGLWAFAHLSYVRDPFYLRGIELLIPALFLLGLFFLRFDLTTTIVAHFTYNAGLGALPLLRSGEPYFVLSGLIVVAAMLAPVMPGLVGTVRRRLRREERVAPQPQLRPATLHDLQALAALPVEGVDWESLLEDVTAVVCCLQAGGKVVGVAAGEMRAEGESEVLVVYVAPRWRRQYWGSRLVDALGAELRARGAQSARATVEADDRLATAFWASQGWRPAVKVFRRSLIPSPSLGWRDVSRWLKARGRTTSNDQK